MGVYRLHHRRFKVRVIHKRDSFYDSLRNSYKLHRENYRISQWRKYCIIQSTKYQAKQGFILYNNFRLSTSNKKRINKDALWQGTNPYATYVWLSPSSSVIHQLLPTICRITVSTLFITCLQNFFELRCISSHELLRRNTHIPKSCFLNKLIKRNLQSSVKQNHIKNRYPCKNSLGFKINLLYIIINSKKK